MKPKTATVAHDDATIENDHRPGRGWAHRQNSSRTSHVNDQDHDARAVIGGLLRFGMDALDHVWCVLESHFDSVKHRAMYHAAIVLADVPCRTDRLMRIGDRLRRIPNLDLSWADVSAIESCAPTTPEDLEPYARRLINGAGGAR